MDEDVPGAVGRELDALLAGRLGDCRALDPVFAHDIAERVARFTAAGGRRIRPLLVWWSFRACGGDDTRVAAVLRTAAALELLQACALVHDDLMDRASTRRGAPALHTDVTRQYTVTVSPLAAHRLGAGAAVLAGDLALAWADDAFTGALLDPALSWDTAHRLKDVWAALRTEMAAGQYLDLQGQATADRTRVRAVRAACLKSARYTVERPVELGAVLAGAGPDTLGALRRAGRCAGLAFQLRDDLDDLFADPFATGKPSGGDVREGKPAYPLAVARGLVAAAGDRYALRVLEEARGRADLTDEELGEVRDVVVATGARDLVERRIARLSERCLRLYDETPPDPAARPRPLARRDPASYPLTPRTPAPHAPGAGGLAPHDPVPLYDPAPPADSAPPADPARPGPAPYASAPHESAPYTPAPHTPEPSAAARLRALLAEITGAQGRAPGRPDPSGAAGRPPAPDSVLTGTGSEPGR
ncbi:polyprenyl synthetase family protein [Streptomyces sp. NPDC048718]|uniref:polyprenyl synthetase family protein n=1 Tax=Streptomyces sp. NPDC048718 TaxID=3365587 RepID=UPI00371A478A